MAPVTSNGLGSVEPLSVGLSSYVAIATRYAEEVDKKPINALYERPCTLSLLPLIAGLLVLDAGCGSGWYAEHFVQQGARVIAVDVTPEMVRLTQNRVGNRAQVQVADLSQPLAFANSGEFDLVFSALTLHYLKDWDAVLGEFCRVLRPAGLLIFSTHHPSADFARHRESSYFETVLVEEQWPVGRVQFYRGR
jgi:SAM-dependent methyltransferase